MSCQLSWPIQTYMNENTYLAFSLLRLSLIQSLHPNILPSLLLRIYIYLFGFPNACVHGIKIKQCNREYYRSAYGASLDPVLKLTSHRRWSTRKNPALYHLENMEGVAFLSSELHCQVVMHSTDAYVQGLGSLGHQHRADSAVQLR